MLAYSGQEHPCVGTPFASGSWPIVGCSLDGGVRRGVFVCFPQLSNTLIHTSNDDAVVMVQGRTATEHVSVTPPRANDRPASLPPGCRVPRGRGGGKRSPFFVLYYVDDGILLEVQWWPDGRRCRRASASLASDHHRLFGLRSPGDPNLLSHKISPWDTRLCVLGWDIDTVAMTISVPLAKLERLRDSLSEWSPDRVVASVELRSLIGRLLHLCEVRPGKYFIRRMLNQVSLPPVRAWSAKFHVSHTRAASSPRMHLGPEFHVDVSFWRLLVARGLGSPAGRLSAHLYRSYMQPPAFTL